MESLLKFRKEIQTYSRSHPEPPSALCPSQEGRLSPRTAILLAQLALLHSFVRLVLAAGPFPRLQGTRPLSNVNSILHLPEEKGTNEETEDSVLNRRRKRYHWLCPKPKKQMPGITSEHRAKPSLCRRDPGGGGGGAEVVWGCRANAPGGGAGGEGHILSNLKRLVLAFCRKCEADGLVWNLFTCIIGLHEASRAELGLEKKGVLDKYWRGLLSEKVGPAFIRSSAPWDAGI